MNLYRCKHCGCWLERDSTKQWVKSYCDTTGRNVHLVLQYRNKSGAKGRHTVEAGAERQSKG
jgi:hypothetical protein